MCLGTLVDALSEETDRVIAEVFNDLPQKVHLFTCVFYSSKQNQFILAQSAFQVIWKYDGKIPAKLNENVIASGWIPQPDLLAHKNTKLFITHGGSHSM